MEWKPYLRKAQFYETDSMGVVYHGNYIHWMEEARTDFLEENQAAVDAFLDEHEESSLAVNNDVDDAAQKVADLGIIPKAEVAKKAIPYCNITCIRGEEMKTDLSGYLQVLYDQDPSSVGGALPGDDFYYIPE